VDTPRAEYERRLTERRKRIAALDRVNLLISNTRLALAALGAVLLWMALVRATISPAWPIATLVAFGLLAFVHARQLNRFERAQAACRSLGWYRTRWRGVRRRSSVRPRPRPVRPRFAVRAAEYDAHRSRRDDARRVARRTGADR
jgi:hypothetical protein